MKTLAFAGLLGENMVKRLKEGETMSDGVGASGDLVRSVVSDTGMLVQAALKAERERDHYRDALREIAQDGCEGNGCRLSNPTCLDLGRDRGEQCFPCIAAAALEEVEP